MSVNKSKKLQIEPEAQYFNDIFLKVQKIGFAIMGLLILAALLGLFGSGFLSHVEKNNGNLNLEYEKFIRQQASTLLSIQLNKCEKENILSISKSFFEKISIKSINPTPFKVVSFNNDIQYYFLCDPTAVGAVNVVLVIEPEQFGLLQGEVAVANDRIALTQFVYP